MKNFTIQSPRLRCQQSKANWPWVDAHQTNVLWNGWINGFLHLCMPCCYSLPLIFRKWFDSRSLCTTSTSPMGKQIKRLVCISSIVIPCKEQLKCSSALLKTIHHETPTNAPPQSDDGNPRWPGKTTSNPENHTGILFKELEKREYARGTFFLQSEMISWMRTRTLVWGIRREPGSDV